MKKLLAFISLAMVSATMLFANVELNPKVFGEFRNIKEEKTVLLASSTISYDMKMFGAELESNFWFSHPWILDIGLHTNYDISFGNAETTYEVSFNSPLAGTSYSLKSSNGVINQGLSIAPALQFNVGSKNSFFIAAGLRLGLTMYSYEVMTSYSKLSSRISVSLFDSDFLLDLGYKFWFVKHIGLNAGYKLEVPMYIKNLNNNEKVEFNSAIANQIYLGLCINLGKRYYGSSSDN